MLQLSGSTVTIKIQCNPLRGTSEVYYKHCSFISTILVTLMACNQLILQITGFQAKSVKVYCTCVFSHNDKFPE